MKKTLALLLALVLIVASAPAAFATSQSTTLTTTVPPASYTLNVPKDTEIPFGATDTSIGYVTVTESSGFAEGKNLAVKLNGVMCFSSETVSTKINYRVQYSSTSDLTASEPTTSHTGTHNSLSLGQDIYFIGTNDGTVERLASSNTTNTEGSYIGDLGIVISASDWGKALAGDYTGTITFTATVFSPN